MGRLVIISIPTGGGKILLMSQCRVPNLVMLLVGHAVLKKCGQQRGGIGADKHARY
jgi:hypothetical protein